MKALYVREGKKPPPIELQNQFGNVQLVDEFWSEHNGQQVSQFQIYLLANN
jgi:hypothetical protein